MIILSKNYIYRILEIATAEDKASKIADIAILALIVINTLAAVLSTVQSIGSRFHSELHYLEVFSVIIFTAEYLLRIWSCTADDRYHKPLGGRIKFALTPLALVDLLAILPFYLPFVFMVDLRVIRIFRMARILRLLKLGRYSKAMKVLGRVVSKQKEELVVCLFAIFTLLILSASIMFLVEHESQPEVFSSIPAAMWWGIATLTTVGYGDIYPVTTLGKITGSIIALSGVGLFALPAGILASGFMEELKEHSATPKQCPHCGGDLQ